MKKRSDSDPLLDDVLAEAIPGAFRNELLEQMLNQVRRRTRVRRWSQRALVIALAASTWLLSRSGPPPSESMVPRSSAVRIVQSQPLDVRMIVETRPGAVTAIDSPAAAVAVVATEPGNELVREIDDDQLLALVAGPVAVLVRPSAGQAELLFINPEDEKDFRLH
jgi:hypothetical protein